MPNTFWTRVFSNDIAGQDLSIQEITDLGSIIAVRNEVLAVDSW